MIFQRILENYTWFKAYQEASKRKHPEREVASVEAENKVAEVISKHNPTWKVLQGIRIPNPDTWRGKGEIDVFVITPKAIFSIEVKNYSCQVSSKGDLLYQKGKSHGSVFKKMNENKSSLKRIAISKMSGRDLDVIPLLVFTNPNVKLDTTLETQQRVCTLKRLKLHMQHIHMNIPDTEKNHVEDVAKLVEDFGSWDSLHWEGGFHRIGDICDNGLPFELNRKEIQEMHITNQRSFWKTLFLGPKLLLTALNYDGNKKDFVLDREHSVDFQGAGNGQSITVSLAGLSRILHGHRVPPELRKNNHQKGKSFPREN